MVDWGSEFSLNSNLGGLFRGSFWGVYVCVGVGGEGGLKLSPCLKLVRIMLETWNLVREYKHIYSFRKYTFWYQGPLNFFAKNLHFLAKILPLLKAIVWELC